MNSTTGNATRVPVQDAWETCSLAELLGGIADSFGALPGLEAVTPATSVEWKTPDGSITALGGAMMVNWKPSDPKTFVAGDYIKAAGIDGVKWYYKREAPRAKDLEWNRKDTTVYAMRKMVDPVKTPTPANTTSTDNKVDFEFTVTYVVGTVTEAGNAAMQFLCEATLKLAGASNAKDKAVAKEMVKVATLAVVLANHCKEFGADNKDSTELVPSYILGCLGAIGKLLAKWPVAWDVPSTINIYGIRKLLGLQEYRFNGNKLAAKTKVYTLDDKAIAQVVADLKGAGRKLFDPQIVTDIRSVVTQIRKNHMLTSWNVLQEAKEFHKDRFSSVMGEAGLTVDQIRAIYPKGVEIYNELEGLHKEANTIYTGRGDDTDVFALQRTGAWARAAQIIKALVEETVAVDNWAVIKSAVANCKLPTATKAAKLGFLTGLESVEDKGQALVAMVVNNNELAARCLDKLDEAHAKFRDAEAKRVADLKAFAFVYLATVAESLNSSEFWWQERKLKAAAAMVSGQLTNPSDEDLEIVSLPREEVTDLHKAIIEAFRTDDKSKTVSVTAETYSQVSEMVSSFGTYEHMFKDQGLRKIDGVKEAFKKADSLGYFLATIQASYRDDDNSGKWHALDHLRVFREDSPAQGEKLINGLARAISSVLDGTLVPHVGREARIMWSPSATLEASNGGEVKESSTKWMVSKEIVKAPLGAEFSFMFGKDQVKIRVDADTEKLWKRLASTTSNYIFARKIKGLGGKVVVLEKDGYWTDKTTSGRFIATCATVGLPKGVYYNCRLFINGLGFAKGVLEVVDHGKWKDNILYSSTDNFKRELSVIQGSDWVMCGTRFDGSTPMSGGCWFADRKLMEEACLAHEYASDVAMKDEEGNRYKAAMARELYNAPLVGAYYKIAPEVCGNADDAMRGRFELSFTGIRKFMCRVVHELDDVTMITWTILTNGVLVMPEGDFVAVATICNGADSDDAFYVAFYFKHVEVRRDPHVGYEVYVKVLGEDTLEQLRYDARRYV
jgi:hypothetical protein